MGSGAGDSCRVSSDPDSRLGRDVKWVADKLVRGEAVTFRPRGHSMEPLVRDGEEVTVVPITPSTTLAPGAVVLCRVRGRIYLHEVLALGPRGALIGNHRGHVNGWTTTLYGVLAPRRR